MGQGDRNTAEKGFSLVELVAALAIVSLLSLTLFQSTRAWLDLSTRSANAAERAIGEIVMQSVFAEVVGGMINAWPEETDKLFVGVSQGFSGLTRRPAEGAGQGLVLATFDVRPYQDGQALFYETSQSSWPLFTVPTGIEAGFTYLGADGVWRSTWPPEINPDPDPLNDNTLYTTPQLPLAIRFSAQGGPAPVTWIADIASASFSEQRDQDLLIGEE